MTSNKETLDTLVKHYNFSAPKEEQIVVSIEKNFLKIELGGHYITKVYTVSPTDSDYKKLIEMFFGFLCRKACKNIPTYIQENNGK